MAAISLLNFPGRRRVPLILQNEASECGLACLAMIAGYHGHKTDLATIQRRNLGVGRGARMTDLMQIAGHLQLSARPVKLALDDLHLLQGPSILHWDFGHYVVLTKVGAGHVVIHDPASGERRLAFDEVSKHFTGVALELTPEAGFQPVEERRRVSVRELVGRVHGLPRALATVVLLALALEAFTLAAPLFMQLVVDGAVVSNDADLLSLLAIGSAVLLFHNFVMPLDVAWFVIQRRLGIDA